MTKGQEQRNQPEMITRALAPWITSERCLIERICPEHEAQDADIVEVRRIARDLHQAASAMSNASEASISSENSAISDSSDEPVTPSQARALINGIHEGNEAVGTVLLEAGVKPHDPPPTPYRQRSSQHGPQSYLHSQQTCSDDCPGMRKG